MKLYKQKKNGLLCVQSCIAALPMATWLWLALPDQGLSSWPVQVLRVFSAKSNLKEVNSNRTDNGDDNNNDNSNYHKIDINEDLTALGLPSHVKHVLAKMLALSLTHGPSVGRFWWKTTTTVCQW